jgi:predicted RND superfamily exporter protein
MISNLINSFWYQVKNPILIVTSGWVLLNSLLLGKGIGVSGQLFDPLIHLGVVAHNLIEIVAEFHKQEGGFQAITKAVESVVAPLRDDTVWIDVGGLPIFLSLLESFSQRMAFLFPLALLIIGLIHYEAFRTFQALFLPLLTALMGVAWSIGVLGLVGQPFDVFNASTPILILAIAAGHAVQILKRYYEEYAALTRQQAQLSPVQRNWMAVESSLTKVGPVMVVACSIAALGFFSLMIFEIKTIRTFGIFTGSGILSALVLELTLIPALRSMLKPPSHHELSREQALTVWDRLIAWFYLQVSQKHWRRTCSNVHKES